MATVQLKISISEELNDRLEAARKKFGKRTTNAIASEVVDDYLHLWEQIETRRRKLVTRQTARVLKTHQKKTASRKKPRK